MKRFIRVIWRNLVRRPHVEQELTNELNAYVELLIAEKEAVGQSSSEARRSALVDAGGIEQVKEQVRQVRAGARIEQVVKDAVYAVRMLRRSPGFAAAAILALALGIGVTTSIFSLVYGVLLRPLPYPEPHELLRVWMNNPAQGIEKDIASWPQFRAWRERNRSFEHMVAVRAMTANLTGSGDPEELRGEAVTEDYFPMYGVGPELGSWFSAQLASPDGAPAVVLSHELWATRFGADRSLVGRTIQLDGRAIPVVGVMPSGFGEAQFWVPLQFREGMEGLREAWGALWLPIFGRLRDGVTIEQAQAEMMHIARELARTNESVEGEGVLLEGLHASEVGASRTPLLLLLAAVVLVLLIACANIANLILARSTARRGELSVRVALGAGRGALVRQALVESVVLGLVGGLVGTALAWVGTKFLVTIGAESLPRLESVRVDGIVLGFSVLASLAASVLFGLVPALDVARHRPGELLSTAGRGAVRGATGVRPMLVTAQFALALVLLYGAGLLLRSFSNLLEVEPGFDSTKVVAVNLNLADDRYPNRAAVLAFYERFLGELRAIPGVRSADAISTLLLSRLPNSGSISVDGKQLSELESNLPVAYDAITPGLLNTMGMTLLRGRQFNEADVGTTARVAIVNQAFVKRFMPERDALGRRFVFGSPQGDSTRWIEVVGVMRDAKRSGLDADVAPYIFTPGVRSRMQVVFRVERDPLAIVPRVRSILRGIDAQQPLSNIRLLDQDLAKSLAPRRFVMLLLAAFAAAAVLLAAIGIYGVLSYMVGRRTREFGVRMALGAQPRAVLNLVMAQAGKPVAIGVLLGTAGAFAAARLLQSQLYGITGFDYGTQLAVVGLLSIVAVIAVWVPARRATGVDPLLALRSE